MELHRAWFIQTRSSKDLDIEHMLFNGYGINNICLETTAFGFSSDSFRGFESFDYNSLYFNNVDGHFGAFVTPDFKHAKRIEDFKARNVSELMIKLDLEGYLSE